MSEETENTEVMSWQEALRIKEAEQQARANALSQGNKFISFKSGILAVDKVPAPGNELEVVVLTFCSENAWYKGKFDPTQVQTPMCWSVYASTAEMIPDPEAKERQAPTCEECAKFKWGSDPQGGRGKACKSRYRLAVLPGGVSTVDEVVSAPIRFAVLPVTSGSDFDKYMSECKMALNRPNFGVVSLLKVTPDVKSQYKVSLKPLRPIPGELMLAMLDRVTEAEKSIMYKYSSMDDDSAEAPKPLK